jgi:Preprotein translocase subunit SecB
MSTNGGQQQGQASQFNVLAQYTKDFSFENPNAPKSLGQPAQPTINVQIDVNPNQLSSTDFEVELADLGFSEDGGSLFDIYNRAVAIGLELCPPDLGPTLRLNYLDQSRGEFLHIAMRPVALYNREVVDFSLGNDGNTLLLLSGDGRPETVLPGAVRFIFVRPRPNTIARDNAPANSGDFAKR